jgi:Flp pilus assembly protein TadG
MPPRHPWTPLVKRWRRFCADGRGNITMTFALALVPVVGLAGAAVDYSRASAIRTSMQSSADSAALAVSKTATSLTQAEIQSQASTYFNATFTRTDVGTPTVTATYTAATSTTAGSTLTVSATTAMNTNFMGVLGISTVTIGASSTTKWGTTRLRVPLALDNTGSMDSNNKMTALKTAATNLITQLQSAAVTDGDVYVSIIPFARYVNVGKTNYNKTWLRWSGMYDTWEENNGSCTKSYSNTAKTSYISDKTACANKSGTWTSYSHTGNSTSSRDWDGSVMDRNQDYDISASTPDTSVVASLFPTAQSDSSDPTPVSLLALTYDWTSLKQKIADMDPSGGTNQPIGLVWAWHSLKQDAPLNAPTEDSKYTYNKVIILLSDGLNTEDRWYGNGSSQSSSVDTRQSTLCANIKAAGVILYTVQVNTSGDATSTVLKNCASSTSKFFLLTSASSIVTTFSAIGTELSQLHVSK